MKTLVILGIAIVVAQPIAAENVREASSHAHGVGKLDIAIEDSKVAMELHAPGADIVGFEYAATSEQDHGKIDAAVLRLSKPLDLFGLPSDAGCTVINATAELEGEEAHGQESHEQEGHTEFHAEYQFDCSDIDAVTKITFPYFDLFPNAKEIELQVVSDKGASAFEIERDVPYVNLSEKF